MARATLIWRRPTAAPLLRTGKPVLSRSQEMARRLLYSTGEENVLTPTPDRVRSTGHLPSPRVAGFVFWGQGAERLAPPQPAGPGSFDTPEQSAAHYSCGMISKVRGISQFLSLTLAALVAVPALAQADPRVAAEAFGNALVSGRADRLRSILPGEGKVRLKLDRFGPEDGFFGAGQVEAIFRNFLKQGSVRSFEVTRGDSDTAYALVHARVVLVDREGRQARVTMQLAFQPESDHWILREIKELRE